MYDIRDEDIDSIADHSRLSDVGQSAPLQMQLPVIELMKVFTFFQFIDVHFSSSSCCCSCASYYSTSLVFAVELYVYLYLIILLLFLFFKISF